jgi:hypothetical protein
VYRDGLGLRRIVEGDGTGLSRVGSARFVEYTGWVGSDCRLTGLGGFVERVGWIGLVCRTGWTWFGSSERIG